MSLVNADTGEVVAYCTPDEARSLTERIKATAESLWSLLGEAHDRKAWAALGYETFSAYATAEFGMSKVHAYRLVGQAEVIREIESATGVTRGLLDIPERAARDIKPRLSAVTDSIKDRLTEEAIAPEPERVKEIVAEVVAEERQKAKDRAEDRAALTDLSASMERSKAFDMDTDRSAERGTWSTHCRDLIRSGEPADFIARHRQYLTDRHIAQAERAYAWLDDFLIQLREAE